MTLATRLQVAPERLAAAARRVMGRCEELARVTATPGSITRVYLSPEHAGSTASPPSGCASWA